MRIRKNGKGSPLRWPSSSPMAGQIIQTHYCQLNQSPWDAMSFSSLPESSVSPRPPSSPPSFSIGKKDMIRAGKECLVGNVSVVERANEKGLPCRRKASHESSLCEYHQSIVKNCGISSNQSKKQVEDHISSRRKKTLANSSSSVVPDEFYYYSGFGPRWRKRRGHEPNVNRGETSTSRNAEHVDDEESESDDNFVVLVEVQEKEEVKKERKRGRPSKKGR